VGKNLVPLLACVPPQISWPLTNEENIYVANRNLLDKWWYLCQSNLARKRMELKISVPSPTPAPEQKESPKPK
jgi:hypothetical protein